MTYRARDMLVEQVIAKFLDINFYPKHVTGFHRYKSKEEQLKGKDVQFSVDGLNNIIVDEKAQSHYINMDLPTFAFELSFIRSSGEITMSWLFDESKETDYYLAIWPFASENWNPNLEQITQLKMLLINRHKLIEYLDAEGFGKEFCMRKSEQIRDENLKGPIDKGKHPYVYFFSTKRLEERPINVVIRREMLERIADKNWTAVPVN